MALATSLWRESLLHSRFHPVDENHTPGVEISLRRAATRTSGEKPLIAGYSDGIDLSELPEQELFDACRQCGAPRTDAAWRQHAGYVECQ